MTTTFLKEDKVGEKNKATATVGQVKLHTTGIEQMMRPRSVAIIGMSSKPGTPSHTVLKNLLNSEFKTNIHLVGRSGGEVEGIPCLTSINQLPEGVDLAILITPAETVRETVEACIARNVKSAVCFSSGFAETGEQGRKEQEEIGRIAREGGLALVGPNCVGYFNYVDAFSVMLVPTELQRSEDSSRPGVAIVCQSGGIGHHIAYTLQQRGVNVSYMVTTGNEAHLGIADLVGFFLADESTAAVVCYAEQIRRPEDMLAVAKLARDHGKKILLLHPGKSAKAQAATASHTGALTGDYKVMRTLLEDAGIVMADALEELIDVSQILTRYPQHNGEGLGIVTMSGALCGIALDYAAEIGIDIPPMSKETVDSLKGKLPDFTPPRNPFDMGTLPAWQPDLLRVGAEAVLADPAVGSVMISNPSVGLPISSTFAAIASTLPADKPLIYVIHSEDCPIPQETRDILKQNQMVLMRSPERAMRALSVLTRHGRQRRGWSEPVTQQPFTDLPTLGSGTHPEWLGKQVLAKIGIAVPEGGLAKSVDEAIAIATRIGFPVALKAQAAALAHKSDVGGVLLNIADEAALRSQWATLYASIERAKPGLVLDGALVEKMGERGVELVVGARRDPSWGPVLLVGMGGVWIEALGDVTLLPALASEAQIVEALGSLKSAKLLRGFRGSPPIDVAAVARAAAQVGRLIATDPAITEIDVNPLVAYGEGKGVVALDALIVTQ
ncbi:CoA-binding protein [Sphingobium terrigena]|uniref:CoA-binding protein n=1 Tax=Sphingobium terrigena TaxID=2304063 RepID=A0A418YM45_9SPHN|nr:acetate--CoA ligase family protein [Sphingobium terrigena]RJG52212.1 CoA-binding protein [Sphingobium terrigena]